jgi:hypothetical protein
MINRFFTNGKPFLQFSEKIELKRKDLRIDFRKSDRVLGVLTKLSLGALRIDII